MEPLALQVGIELSTRTLTLGGVVTVAVLVGLSGFFSSAEIALFSLADYKIDAMVSEGLAGADRVAALKADPHRLLVTILVGNNVVNIAMASISTAVLAMHVPPAQSVVVSTFGITALVLLFGESAPKSYAVEHSASWARRVARPLQLSSYLMYPLVALFDVLTRQVNRLTGTTGTLETPYVTRTELQQLIETGEREGVIEAGERELLLGVFEFRNRIAKEIMQSRLDVTAVETGASVEAAIDACLDAGRVRLPVYEGTLDTVVGVVELPDLVAAWRERGAGAAGEPDGPTAEPGGERGIEPGAAAPTAGDIAGPVVQIPETKDVDELLVEMREGRHRVAIVVDEFGTTQGLVTLDDVLEELVGEILEEAEQPSIRLLDERTARVRGDLNVHELNEAFDAAIPEGEVFETVAGFVIDHLGRIPGEGDVVEHGGLRLVVERMDNARVRVLRVTRVDEGEGTFADEGEESDSDEDEESDAGDGRVGDEGAGGDEQTDAPPDS